MTGRRRVRSRQSKVRKVRKSLGGSGGGCMDDDERVGAGKGLESPAHAEQRCSQQSERHVRLAPMQRHQVWPHVLEQHDPIRILLRLVGMARRKERHRRHRAEQLLAAGPLRACQPTRVEAQRHRQRRQLSVKRASHLRTEVIRGNQRYSEVLRGTQR